MIPVESFAQKDAQKRVDLPVTLGHIRNASRASLVQDYGKIRLPVAPCNLSRRCRFCNP